jgi:hypothetical protein
VAAADARNTSTGRAAWTRELSAGPTTDALHAALAAGTAVGPTVLTASSAVTIGITPTAARILLEDHVSGGRAGRACTRFCRRHRHYSHRCGNRTTNNKRFQHSEYGHVRFFTPSTHAQNIEFQS